MAIKVGTGIKTGKTTGKYVDPDRFGKIKVGKGDGDGYGSGTGTGNKTVKAPVKKCDPVKAKPIKQVKVPPSAYPPAAKRRGIEGTLVALLYLDEKGNVERVKVTKTLGYGFDELAIDAFKKWKFTPAEKNCSPTKTVVRYNYTFSLDPY